MSSKNATKRRQAQLTSSSVTKEKSERNVQIFLNLRRRSTYGLSNLSVAITTVGKITDFAENYLLIMPMQYVVMAFFSSSIAELGTLQVTHFHFLGFHSRDGRKLGRIRIVVRAG